MTLISPHAILPGSHEGANGLRISKIQQQTAKSLEDAPLHALRLGLWRKAALRENKHNLPVMPDTMISHLPNANTVE